MKKLFILIGSVLMMISSFAYAPANIDEQLLRSFAFNFPNAQKVVWQEHDEAYVVSFTEDDIRMRITYLRNGEVTHILRYYYEQNLPLTIRLNIKKQFPDKKIFGVIEENLISNVENRSKIVYHVKLEDERNWYTIKIQKNKRVKLTEKLNKDNSI
jgi:hypothetical protein